MSVTVPADRRLAGRTAESPCKSVRTSLHDWTPARLNLLPVFPRPTRPWVRSAGRPAHVTYVRRRLPPSRCFVPSSHSSHPRPQGVRPGGPRRAPPCGAAPETSRRSPWTLRTSSGLARGPARRRPSRACFDRYGCREAVNRCGEPASRVVAFRGPASRRTKRRGAGPVGARSCPPSVSARGTVERPGDVRSVRFEATPCIGGGAGRLDRAPRPSRPPLSRTFGPELMSVGALVGVRGMATEEDR